MSENKLTKTTIQVPAGLLRQVRIKAAMTGISMSEVCRRALAAWVEDKPSKEQVWQDNRGASGDQS